MCVISFGHLEDGVADGLRVLDRVGVLRHVVLRADRATYTHKHTYIHTDKETHAHTERERKTHAHT